MESSQKKFKTPKSANMKCETIILNFKSFFKCKDSNPWIFTKCIDKKIKSWNFKRFQNDKVKQKYQKVASEFINFFHYRFINKIFFVDFLNFHFYIESSSLCDEIETIPEIFAYTEKTSLFVFYTFAQYLQSALYPIRWYKNYIIFLRHRYACAVAYDRESDWFFFSLLRCCLLRTNIFMLLLNRLQRNIWLSY